MYCLNNVISAYAKPKSTNGKSSRNGVSKDSNRHRHYRETSVQTVPKTLINDGATLTPKTLLTHEEEDPYTDYKTIVRMQEKPTRKVDIIQVEETREDDEFIDVIDGRDNYGRRVGLVSTTMNGQSGFTSQASPSPSMPIRGVRGLYASVQPMASRSQSAMRSSDRTVVLNGIQGTNGIISEVEDDSVPSTVR